jgi:hypothetical protein
MKKIEDYLHLYLPVRVELNNGGSKVYNRTAVAVGNMDDEYRYVTLRLGKGAKSFTHSILFSEPDRIKPILRPLSDMTEDERTILCLATFPDYKQANDIRKHEEGYMFRNENGIKCYMSMNHFNPILFIWLLKNHFDLFGLIEAGLAIDKTKTEAVK